ncbi:MAG: hypothetical protein Q8K63_11610 [Acidimicrobiales bacterium]|nr:hypothetical protein [Acidimicrobiales bacterium]
MTSSEAANLFGCPGVCFGPRDQARSGRGLSEGRGKWSDRLFRVNHGHHVDGYVVESGVEQKVPVSAADPDGFYTGDGWEDMTDRQKASIWMLSKLGGAGVDVTHAEFSDMSFDERVAFFSSHSNAIKDAACESARVPIVCRNKRDLTIFVIAAWAGALTGGAATAALAAPAVGVSTFTAVLAGGAVGGATTSVVEPVLSGEPVTLEGVAQGAALGIATAGAGHVIGKVVKRAAPAIKKLVRPGKPSTSIAEGAPEVTETMIRETMVDAPLHSQQGAISLPRVQRYVDMLAAGSESPPIKVDGSIIIDGNHRYVAGRIMGQEPPIQPWAGGSAARVVPWWKQIIDPNDWLG